MRDLRAAQEHRRNTEPRFPYRADDHWTDTHTLNSYNHGDDENDE